MFNLKDSKFRSLLFVFVLVGVFLFKTIIVISLWKIPFSWDNWRYISTAYSLSESNFHQLILSGQTYQSFFTFPVGLPLLIHFAHSLTPTFYDAGRLTVFLTSLWLLVISAKLFFPKFSEFKLLSVLIWILFITFKTINWTSHAIYPESVALPFFVYGFYRIIQFDVFSYKNAFIIGLLSGFSFLIKPEGLTLGLIYASVVIFTLFSEKKEFSKLIKVGLFSITGLFLIISGYEYLIFKQHQQWLPLITTYHLDRYSEMGGTDFYSYFRNLFDNMIHILPIQFKWYYIGLFFPFIAIKSIRLSKALLTTFFAIVFTLFIHSKGFGVSFLQFNPEDALPRYTLIYVFLVFYFVHLLSQFLTNKSRILFAIYLILLIPLSIRQTIPFSWYYPKGWKNKVIAEDIRSNPAYHPDSLIVSNGEILTYLEHRNGINMHFFKSWTKIDSSVISYSYKLHLRKDSLQISDPFGHVFIEKNDFIIPSHEN